MTATKNTKNVWTNGSKRVTSPSAPDSDYYPRINIRRVSGSSYTPYTASAGSAEWVARANRLLADIARSNFELGRR